MHTAFICVCHIYICILVHRVCAVCHVVMLCATRLYVCVIHIHVCVIHVHVCVIHIQAHRVCAMRQWCYAVPIVFIFVYDICAAHAHSGTA